MVSNLYHTAPIQPDLTTRQFQLLRNMIAAYSGVTLDASRRHVLCAGLSQRMAVTNQSATTYISQLQHTRDRAELQQLTELVLNHETLFFRNQPHTRALRTAIIPSLHRQKPPGAPLRVWSAGCSTGEEAYSLAIIAHEVLPSPLQRPVEIIATDLSERALAKARRGVYHGRTLTKVPAQIRTQHFVGHQDTWTISSHIRELVSFEQMNLLESFPAHLHDIDIIVCQNVTMYFEHSTRRDLITRFYNTLNEDGILLLGASEILHNMHHDFRLQEVGTSFVYYKKAYAQPSRQSAAEPYGPNTSRVAVTREGTQRSHVAHNPPNAHNCGTSQARRHHSAHLGELQRAQPTPPNDEVAPCDPALLTARHPEAATTISAHISLDSVCDSQTLTLIAQTHADRGSFALATAAAQHAIALDPLATDAYVLMGMLCMQQGQPLAAAQYIERARYLDPDAAFISYQLAEMYRQAHRHQEAVREYRNALRKLAQLSPDLLLSGVAVYWIRETCQRYIEMLTREGYQKGSDPFSGSSVRL